jgi:hypothetical protein
MVREPQALAVVKSSRNSLRKVVCFLLPNCEIAPFDQELFQAIALQIVRKLYITQHVLEASVSKMGRLTLCLFHGNAPEQSVETFDKVSGRPKRQRYTPNKKMMLVVDPKNRFFYVVVDKKYLLKVLQSLNGTLFPKRQEETPFVTIKPNLEHLPYLFSDARFPMNSSYAHKALRLKGVTCYGAGVKPLRVKIDWPTDGFDTLDLGLLSFVKRIQSVRLEVVANHYETPFGMTLYRDAGVISVQLSEKTFDIIPDILKLCTEGLTAQQQLSFNLQSEFLFPIRNAR